MVAILVVLMIVFFIAADKILVWVRQRKGMFYSPEVGWTMADGGDKILPTDKK